MNISHLSVGSLVCALAALLLIGVPAHARITRITIDQTVSPAFCKSEHCASYGSAGQYEQIAGRAYGELDPGCNVQHCQRISGVFNAAMNQADCKNAV